MWAGFLQNFWQRVALARALLAPAQLWLLDEPLSSLDALARRELAPLLATLCRELGQPILYVTHALPEVLQIADYIVVLENGRVVAAGNPDDVGRQIDHPISAEIDVGGILAELLAARALLAPAQLWLLDEPLSSLDALARRELAPLLATLCRELGQPILYVTHALPEVLQIADYIVVLENGRVVAAGNPDDVGRQIDHPISAEIDVGGILAELLAACCSCACTAGACAALASG